jgi:poly-gamma-glutamate system protein
MYRLLPSPFFKPGIKIKSRQLFFLFSLSMALLLINQLSVHQVPKAEYAKMAAAAETMHQAIRHIRIYREQENIPINRAIDPNLSGLIGIEFSPITTTPGDLESKQTSLNPDFAALLIFWFHQLHLSPGDRVMIHASASFPALSIAAIIASETAGLEAVITSSAGASSFGANIPGLTYWDMENSLWQQGIIKHHTQFATPGGEQDNGSSLWEGGMEIVGEAARRNGYPLLIAEGLEKAIEEKGAFFKQYEPAGLFINIGGNQSALGNSNCSLQIPPGIIDFPLPCKTATGGLIHRFNRQNVPVIHLLNIRDIALQNGIALSPHPLPEPGPSPLYYTTRRPRWLPIVSLAVIFAALLWITIRLSIFRGDEHQGHRQD